MTFHVGEALVGEGNEVAHIDLIIGDKSGPAGTAFAIALANQSKGHSNLMAVLEPNLLVKPVDSKWHEPRKDAATSASERERSTAR